jgi:hypothetical protein
MKGTIAYQTADGQRAKNKETTDAAIITFH